MDITYERIVLEIAVENLKAIKKYYSDDTASALINEALEGLEVLLSRAEANNEQR